MVIFILILLAIIIYFMYWIFRMRNPYTSILYVGKKGSGKSTLITKQILKFHNSNCIYYDEDKKKWIKTKWKIYSNVQVYVPFKVYKFNVSDLGKFVPEPNSIVFIDEVNLYFDNRNFKAFTPEMQAFFRTSRKLRVKLMLYSQSFDTDKKIRTLIDEMWLLQNILGVFSYAKRITKVIDIKESALNADSQLVDTIKFASILQPHSRKFTFIPKYIKYFKSFENMTNTPYYPKEYWPLYIPEGSKKIKRPTTILGGAGRLIRSPKNN